MYPLPHRNIGPAFSALHGPAGRPTRSPLIRMAVCVVLVASFVTVIEIVAARYTAPGPIASTTTQGTSR